MGAVTQAVAGQRQSTISVCTEEKKNRIEK